MKSTLLAVCVIAIGTIANPLRSYGGLIADLHGDWSDTSNPNTTANGIWTYREGTNALPLVNDWTPLGATAPQPAWAPGNDDGNFLPAIFRSTTDLFDWQTGDVIVHSTDPTNGSASSTVNVVWTSAISTTVNLDGAAWMVRDLGRGNDWRLLLNGDVLSTGHIQSGDGFSRSAPFSFQNGSGGSAALANLSLTVGDQISLEVVKTSVNGDFVGVNLSITSVPEPSSFGLLIIAGIAVTRRSVARRCDGRRAEGPKGTQPFDGLDELGDGPQGTQPINGGMNSATAVSQRLMLASYQSAMSLPRYCRSYVVDNIKSNH
jgi:hypothetical protein